MALVSDDFRDIRERVFECLVLMECVKVALEMAKRKAEDRNAKIDLGALGKFIDEVDDELRDLDDAIGELLTKDIEIDPGEAATALAFYGNPKNHVAKRGEQSEVGKDGGAIARKALEKVSGEDGEDGE